MLESQVVKHQRVTHQQPRVRRKSLRINKLQHTACYRQNKKTSRQNKKKEKHCIIGLNRYCLRMFVAIFHRIANGSSHRVFNAKIAIDQLGENAAEWVFHATNAPEELLDDEQKWFFSQYRAARLRSVSVGDVVQVGEEDFFRCDSCGWTKLNYLGDFSDEDEE